MADPGQVSHHLHLKSCTGFHFFSPAGILARGAARRQGGARALPHVEQHAGGPSRAISVGAAAARGGSGVAVALRRRRPWRPAARAGFLPSGGQRRVRWRSWRVPPPRPLFSHLRWAAAHPAGTGRAWPCAVAAARAVKGKRRPSRGARTAVLGGASAKGGAGPSAAAGAAAGTSGSERGSRSGDGDEAKLRARVPAAGARGRAPATGCLLIFFVCQKYFGTGWSFQPVPMDA